MKDYEFDIMVNNNHKKVKAQEFNIPVDYSEHELRMAQLERKAKANQVKANVQAIKYGLFGLAMVPVAYICMRMMIAGMWIYALTVRGF